MAEQLGVQVKTVYVLIHERGLPAFRLGRTLRVKEQDMERWLEGQRIPNPGEALFVPDLRIRGRARRTRTGEGKT